MSGWSAQAAATPSAVIGVSQAMPPEAILSEDIAPDDFWSDDMAPDFMAPVSPDFMAPAILSTAAICPLESIAVKAAQVMSSADIWAKAGPISTPERIVIASRVFTVHLRSVVSPSGPPKRIKASQS